MVAAPHLVAALAAALAAAIVQQDPPPVCYDAPPAASHPENDQRRVALLLRGESFRGLHMGLTSDLKRDVVCLPASYDVQKACAENIVEHVIEALEKQGVAVDVFVSTYGCVGAAYAPLTDAEARRTLGNAYLCMVSEGDRSPPVAAAVKKEPPSATHGSLVVIEHGRRHKTTIRCPLFALETPTPSH